MDGMSNQGIARKVLTAVVSFLAAIALVMTQTLAAPSQAQAADTYPINITSTEAGHTYEAYQVFAGTPSSDGQTLSDVTWGTGIDSSKTDDLIAALKTDATLGTKMAKVSSAADVADALNGANADEAAAFADVVAKYTSSTKVQSSVVNDEAGQQVGYRIDAFAAGYYLVQDADMGEAQGVSYTKYILQVVSQEGVTVVPKTSTPTLVKKVQEDDNGATVGDTTKVPDTTYGTGYNDTADADIDQAVSFKLYGSVPADMSAYSTYSYTFHDTMSAGLTFDSTSVQVYLADKTDAAPSESDIVSADKYTLTPDADGHGFTVAIADLKTLTAANGSFATSHGFVIVQYSASLNENAVVGRGGEGSTGNVNTAYLEYSNNPNGQGTGRTPDDKVIVFTYGLDGNKVDANTREKLQGVTFQLVRQGASGAEYARVANGKLTGWTTDSTANDTILTSDENGQFKVAGLDDGTYRLQEEAPLDGYNQAGPWDIVITANTSNGQSGNGAPTELAALNVKVDNGDATSGDLGTGTVAVTVENRKGFSLPKTGDMGTMVLGLAGIAIAAGAVITLAVRKRARDAE